MSAYFEPLGPFPLKPYFSPDFKSTLITSQSAKDFEGACHCAYERGVYIFALGRKGKGAPLPWYVGKTKDRDFAFEAFTGDKLLKYARARTMASGTAFMYVLRFVGHGNAAPAYIDDLETLCVLLARNVNPHLLNRMKMQTKVSRIFEMSHLQIAGVLNRDPGKPSHAAKHFMKLLDLVL